MGIEEGWKKKDLVTRHKEGTIQVLAPATRHYSVIVVMVYIQKNSLKKLVKVVIAIFKMNFMCCPERFEC